MISVLAELLQGVSSRKYKLLSKPTVLDKNDLKGNPKLVSKITKSYAAKKLPDKEFGFKTKRITRRKTITSKRSRIPFVPAA